MWSVGQDGYALDGGSVLCDLCGMWTSAQGRPIHRRVEAQQSSSNPAGPADLESLKRRALLLDLEVSQKGKILKIGAVFRDRTFSWTGNFSLKFAFDELAGLAGAAECVLGHNLARHDLRVLGEKAPDHPLLRLPIIDTLALSPIAFPENPYHRLVKDYKLVKESVNDPVADAVQAAVLFEDQWQSLAGLRQTEPGLFELLRFLLTTPDEPAEGLAAGMGMVFAALRGGHGVPEIQGRGSREQTSDVGETAWGSARALELCRELFRRWGCASMPADESLIQTTRQRLALAYAVTWLRIAGSASVLPPWVRLEHPLAGDLIKRLRETPCGAADCAYCRRAFDAREQLRGFFGFDDFRPLPANGAGGSLQRDIVEAGMRNESLLAILPTGGGKSLCFQIPALARNYRRGVLTIVISPLQALMKDQVDGLVRRTGTSFAAALYGLLTPPERGDVLRRVRMGDVALLYVSPEQLRNRSFRDAIAQREIGCWVFDEAHCLSKWGHDFRPDYLYAGRFIREFCKDHRVEIPPIACFTATAKRDVKEEILAYFKTELARDLALFEGGVERDNLHFEVQTITARGKPERIHDLLAGHLPDAKAGNAIVFRATREAAESIAEFLRAKGWRAAHFHAGMTPSEKKRIQDEFLGGDLQVICATNAFGMGIDKEDVRLVIHADTPGSLENYLQEAGRAGRDGRIAQCVLLYDEEDCEQQFRLGAFSELSRRDIAQILRGLRKAAHRGRDEVVITAGEILRDEDVETSIGLQDRDADTKVRTAVSWLERAGFLQRDENITNVFQARLLVRDLKEAEEKMARLNLQPAETALWTAILRELMNAGPAESLTVDRLALLPEFAAYARGGAWGDSSPQATSPEKKAGGETMPEPQDVRVPANPAPDPPRGQANPEYVSAKVLKTLGGMAQAGLLKRDTLLNAFVRHKVADPSRHRFDRIVQIDRKLVDLLAVEEPDPEGWMPLSLRLLNQRLLDEGLASSTEAVRSLLKSLSEDGRGFAGTNGSIDLRYVAHDSYRVRVRRPWAAIAELADKRRRVASVVLEVLLGKIPADTPATADLLVEFSFEELHNAIERDLLLRSELKDMDAALERALMYLHEQHVIVLQQGLAVFRSAMTIRMTPEARRDKFRASHYRPLEHHYRERVLQVHVMSEYARRGLDRIREALGLVLAYFTLDKEEFVRRYLAAKPELLNHATTARSYQRIVSDLNNPAQIKIVTAPLGRNLLILAGPGSGKTRTVVHRCAYLLRVERIRPQGILVCCFNRHAALELRRRLADLVGNDARGVTVLTYHGLAMRLLGYSFAGKVRGKNRAASAEEPQAPAPEKPDLDLDALIPEAVKLLQGEKVPPGLEPDEVRDRLLAGFQHILVDEYQDIDEPQYQMISAIAGRLLDDPDQKLSILAVGDDDQNVYSFRGSNVRFIRRFQEDYEAEVHYLVENYRSTRHIIEVANHLIAANSDRMKTSHPIRIDRQREPFPAGGEFERRDDRTRGKVQVIGVRDSIDQAQAVLAEIRRLRQLGAADWSRVAVLSRNRQDLARVRALAEAEGIPVRWCVGQEHMPPLHQIREVHRFLERLAQERHAVARASELGRFASVGPEERGKARPEEPQPAAGGSPNPWSEFVARMLEAWRIESDDAELSVQDAIEFFYEMCAESRRDFSYGQGIVLSTVHSAKGTEYDHVLLIGAWLLKPDRARQEEERRAFYVGMTRARQTLAVFDREDARPSLPQTLSGAPVLHRPLQDLPQPGGGQTQAANGPSQLNEAPAGTRGGLKMAADATSRRAILDYTVLGLDDIHLGYPARFEPAHAVHAGLNRLEPGARLTLRPAGSQGLGLFDAQGICVARLSQKGTALWSNRLEAIREIRLVAMVHRSAEQETDPARRARCRSAEWEIPMIEVVGRQTDESPA